MKAAAVVADRGDAPQAPVGASPRLSILLDQAGVPVAVVTNQAGVACGMYSLDHVAAVQKRSFSAWRGCVVWNAGRATSRRSDARNQ